MTASDKEALVEAVERLASDWTTVASLMKRCLTPGETQDAPAEEKPTAPVRIQITQTEQPRYDDGFSQFNFEEGLWNE